MELVGLARVSNLGGTNRKTSKASSAEPPPQYYEGTPGMVYKATGSRAPTFKSKYSCKQAIRHSICYACRSRQMLNGMFNDQRHLRQGFLYTRPNMGYMPASKCSDVIFSTCIHSCCLLNKSPDPFGILTQVLHT